MELIADGLLIAGAVAAALYCWVLSKRVSALKSLDTGVGNAIAELSKQVEEIRVTIDDARAATDISVTELAEKTSRAEVAAGRLELLLASLHDENGEVLRTGSRVAKARAEARERTGADARDVDTGEVQTDEQDPDGETPRDDVLHVLRNIVKGMQN